MSETPDVPSIPAPPVPRMMVKISWYENADDEYPTHQFGVPYIPGTGQAVVMAQALTAAINLVRNTTKEKTVENLIHGNRKVSVSDQIKMGWDLITERLMKLYPSSRIKER